MHSWLAKGSLGEPVHYTLKPWSALTKSTEAGHLEASNNYAGRCMKTVAVGRNAFLFVGSERAAHAASSYYPLVESCKANKINPLTYLTYILSHARKQRCSCRPRMTLRRSAPPLPADALFDNLR